MCQNRKYYGYTLKSLKIVLLISFVANFIDYLNPMRSSVHYSSVAGISAQLSKETINGLYRKKPTHLFGIVHFAFPTFNLRISALR